MVKVCCYLPSFVNTSTAERSKLWVDFIRETAKSFGAKVYIVSTGNSDSEILIQKYATGQGCAIIGSPAELEGAKVYLDKAGSDLEDFVHPQEDAIYILGRDDGQSVEVPDKSISINTGTSYSLWSAVALGIALNDRRKQILSNPHPVKTADKPR